MSSAGFDARLLVGQWGEEQKAAAESLCLPFPREGERQTLGLVMQVPRESLTWKAGTAVEVYGYDVADDGTVRDHLAQLARVDPAKADPQGGVRGLSFFGTLNVPPGRYSVRLLVREGESSGVQVLDVTVPPHDPDVAFLLPPIVVDEPERWHRVGMGAAQENDDRRPFPDACFLLNSA